jgi:lysophospholipid acyltransferase (LPLAT)-like uncharacterized protein
VADLGTGHALSHEPASGPPVTERGPVLPLRQRFKNLRNNVLIPGFLGWYLELCRRTARWDIVGLDRMQGLAGQPQGFVLAFWHECLPLMPLAWNTFWDRQPPGTTRKPGLVLVSRSRDGRMMANLMQKFHLVPVEGSSSKGGQAAAQQLLVGLQSGAVAIVVPDGPRGPRRRISAGGARLAAMAGVPILPCNAAAWPCIRTGSWDRMAIPLPFARCVAVVGTPIMPDAETIAEATANVERGLNETMQTAEIKARAG